MLLSPVTSKGALSPTEGGGIISMSAVIKKMEENMKDKMAKDTQMRIKVLA